MRHHPRRIVAAALLAVGLMAPVTAAADEPAVGTHSENLTFVDNISYAARNGGSGNYGTDMEFAELVVDEQVREVAVAGSYRNGMHLIDITDPEDATVLGVYDCGITQGDVQVFTRGDLPGRTFATYTSDTFGDGTSTCYREAAAVLGVPLTGMRKANGQGKNGSFIVDITDPRAPFTVGFVEFTKGSHNQTVHPSGRYLYNSNSDLITSAGGQGIEIADITDFTKPKALATLALPLKPGLGTESHDITFNAAGTRAYSAALSQTVIINTEDPAKPTIVSSFVDPAINVEHQADPITLTAPDGTRRDFLVIEDEFAGAAGGPQCPNGGVHIYDITGAKEASPEKVGYWNISDARATSKATGRCTAHVFRLIPEAGLMTIAYYNGGVRVVDLNGLAGYGLGSTALSGSPMKEIAFYRFSNADAWSAKTNKVDANGDFYLYANDTVRGFDIFRFRADGAPSTSVGTWLTPAQALKAARANPAPTRAELRPFCLLPQ